MDWWWSGAVWLLGGLAAWLALVPAAAAVWLQGRDPDAAGMGRAVTIAVRLRRWWLLPSVVVLVVGLTVGLTSEPPALSLFGVLALVPVVLIGVVAGSPAVDLVLELATGDRAEPGPHGGILVRSADEPAPAQPKELLRGGITIGYLERFALIGSVVAGYAGAVAIIVAVKGLGRFSDLEDEAARERFIIGTLASLTWSGLTAATVLALWT